MIVELISVGTELLLGNIVNTNAQYLSETCAKLGLNVYYQTTVGDNRERMTEVFRTALSRADLVIIGGGLGPTEDDITMADYARYYEIPFVVAATKLDKVPRSQQSKQINVIAKALACAPEAIIPFSSITQQVPEELLEAIDALFNPEEPESE